VVAAAPIVVDGRAPIYLEIRARNDRYDFLYATQPNAWKTLVADADGTILSTRIGGGFVGSMFGLYNSGSESK
jgi:alpha-N-arabinofuranosidase